MSKFILYISMTILGFIFMPFYANCLNIDSTNIKSKTKDTLVFCYNCDTLSQTLVFQRIDDIKIDFELSSYNKLKNEIKRVNGVAENKYSSDYGSEMDFNEDGEMYLVIEYLYESEEIFLSFRFNKEYTKVNVEVADEVFPNKYCPLHSIKALSKCKSR
jgi:hypothetical protein